MKVAFGVGRTKSFSKSILNVIRRGNIHMEEKKSALVTSPHSPMIEEDDKREKEKEGFICG